MKNDKFTWRYLSKFEDDLREIVNYISLRIHNRDSAMKLVDKALE